MSLLEIKDMSVHYGRIQAIESLSITVEQGEIVTLIGANGAGKTSTMRAISGLVQLSHGSITLDGEDITRLKGHKRVQRGISLAPEGRGIFPAMTVAENLDMGAYGRRERAAMKEDLERVFDLFPRMKERINQRGGTMSGGEQQMLAIGRALMSRPKLILLDEPSMGLAPVMVLRLFDLIRRIREEGYTILVVEQNVRQVLKLVDRAYLLEVGRIKMEGRADQLSEQDFVRKAYVGL
jgi:branched-chain amino acid transport system ATP-binding protein